jgi:GWxTD domain-containing protein
MTSCGATLVRFKESVSSGQTEKSKRMPMRRTHSVWSAVLLWGLFSPAFLAAQESTSDTDEPSPVLSPSDSTESTANETPLQSCFHAPNVDSPKEQESETVAALPPYYRDWLVEDVLYIVTPEERCAYLHLVTSAERDQFIKQFWLRRASDPDSLDDDFQGEHYRRIILANEKFGIDIPGWQTDRGRIYILYGPPDEMESHLSTNLSWTPPEGVLASTKCSWENWHYSYLQGIQENIDLQFVDVTGSGDYRLRMPPEYRDALIFEPNPRVTLLRGMGMSREVLDRLELSADSANAPLARNTDLQAALVSHLVQDDVYFTHRIEFAKATHASTLATIIVDIPPDQLSAPPKENAPVAYEIFGLVSRPAGTVVFTFERSGKLNEHSEAQQSNREHSVALEPGPYDLALAVKDSVSGRVGIVRTAFDVP